MIFTGFLKEKGEARVVILGPEGNKREATFYACEFESPTGECLLIDVPAFAAANMLLNKMYDIFFHLSVRQGTDKKFLNVRFIGYNS